MMTRLLPDSSAAILECVEAVVDLNDALDIVAACYERNSNRVLLRDRQLPAAFFDLKTRFAGEFIQKLVNYQIAVACVFDGGTQFGQRFLDYIGEAKRGRQFRSFDNEDSAIAWLEEQ